MSRYENGRFLLTPEQSLALAQEGSPAFVPGAFQLATSLVKDEEKITAAFQTGKGVGWHEHHHDLFAGHRAVLPPRLCREPGQRLDPGARRRPGEARGGRARRRRRLRPRRLDDPDGGGATRGPSSSGSTTTRARSRRAREKASEAGLGGRVSLRGRQGQGVPRRRLRPGGDVRLPARHGRPRRGGRARARVARRRRHVDDRRAVRHDRLEDNLNPVGRVFYSASTLVCTPASRDQEVGLALGAQAGEARLREVVTEGGFTRFRRATETPFNLVLEARP